MTLPKVGELWLLDGDEGMREWLCTSSDGSCARLTDGTGCASRHWPDSPGRAERLELHGGSEHPPDRVTIWPWADAPEEYRAVSDHGGDEDWIAFVPWRPPGAAATEAPYWIWLRVVCSVSAHRVLGGTIYIAAHA